MNEACRFVVTGRVQGVAFRDWSVARARALDLAGWVRNRADGSVEAVAGGRADAVAAFAAALREGPAMALVDTVTAEARNEAPTGRFERRPDA